MTKTEALIKCRDHWQWIVDNTNRLFTDNQNICPIEVKDAYFIENDMWDKRPVESCFCCGYANSCKNCPLVGYAWEECCPFGTKKFPSVYMEWCRAVNAQDACNAKYFAIRMVIACEMALLDENKGE